MKDQKKANKNLKSANTTKAAVDAEIKATMTKKRTARPASEVVVTKPDGTKEVLKGKGPAPVNQDGKETPRHKLAARNPQAPCLCGCGKLPSGRRSKFASGHDMKLKSQILSGEGDISPEAASYVTEKWPKFAPLLAVAS